MSQSDYETKGELMLNKPQNYGIEEFPEVIIEVDLAGESDLAEQLEEVYVEVLERRDVDPDEQFNITEV